MPKRPSSNQVSREEAEAESDQECEYSSDEFEDEPEHVEGEEEVEDGEEGDDGEMRIFRPGMDTLAEDEELVPADGAYKVLERMQLDWPCLSFDFVEPAGTVCEARVKYPLSCLLVAGTQADRADKNKLYVMNCHNLPKQKSKMNSGLSDDSDDDDSSDSSDEDDDDQEAALEFRALQHPGGVNRVRSMPQAPEVVATWSGDEGAVFIWDIEREIQAVTGSKIFQNFPDPHAKPLFKYSGHKTEGYALAWNPSFTGQLVSGDCSGGITNWQPAPGGGWAVSDLYTHAGGSVEDVQFKKTGTGAVTTLAAAGAGGFVSIIDLRQTDQPALHIDDSHGNCTDVNVVSWNPVVGELLLTGADDGSFKVWDSRNFNAGALAHFHWHKDPVTSVEWHPTDETVLAVSSADDSISLWDMSLEADEATGTEQDYFPAQLLFLHQGQQAIKEVKFHPKHSGLLVSTALDGFNIFKTLNV